ncbi:MAG: glycosyltransferase family 4 protein, partial [Gemmatimonadota bacterium]
VVLHRPSALPRDPGPIERWCERRVVRAHVAPTPAVRRMILACEPWVPEHAIAVIPNGVDLARFASARAAELGLPAGAVVVGYVGRLAREKGIATLGRAWRQVERERPLAHLVVVGSGGEASTLRGALGDAGRVRWLGFRDDVPSVMAALDVVVLPSLTEAFGLVAVEAMAAGIPVVATSVEGLAEVVQDGREGILVPPGEPEPLARAIARLAGDPEERRRLGEAGRHTARRYSIEAMAAAYERLLCERVARDGGGGRSGDRSGRP